MQPLVKRCETSDEFYIDEGCYITEISNSNADPDLSIARGRVEPGVTTKLHILQNTIERYVIIEGKGLIKVGSQLLQEVLVGDVVIIPPSCPQCITNTGESDLIFLLICTPRFSADCYQEVLE